MCPLPTNCNSYDAIWPPSHRKGESPKDPRRCHFLRFSPCDAMRCALVCEIDNLRAIRTCVCECMYVFVGRVARKVARKNAEENCRQWQSFYAPPFRPHSFHFLRIFHCHVAGSCRLLLPTPTPTHIPTSFSTIFRTFFPSFRALALGEFTCACIRLVLHSAPPAGGKGKANLSQVPFVDLAFFCFLALRLSRNNASGM